MRLLFTLFISTISLHFTSAQIEINLAINEVNVDNENNWIELYNYSETSISLKNAFFSDDLQFPFKWKINAPDSIKAKSFEVFKLNELSTNTNDFTSNHLYLSFKIRGLPVFVDDFKLKNNNNSYCKFPDGFGKIYKTTLITPGAPNKLREFLKVSINPNLGLGLSSAQFNQTQLHYNVSSGVFRTLGADLKLYFWERYSVFFGVNYTFFNYSYTSEGNKYYVNSMAYVTGNGVVKTNWIETKIPILYNSFRVYKNWLIDGGFLVSSRIKKYEEFDQMVTYYVNGAQYGEPLKYQFKSYANEPLVRFPMILKITYLKNNWEFFTTYYLRKDVNDKAVNSIKNKKESISLGVAYNFNVMRLQKIF